MLYLSVKFHLISFSDLYVIAETRFKAQFDLWPDCCLGLKHMDLTLVRDTPYYYALYFCEVSLNSLQ